MSTLLRQRVRVELLYLLEALTKRRGMAALAEADPPERAGLL
ncbi:hypothetical protein P186_0157 [Pyrobaculum ferrireducens]|uniref:Uncharacterized protein n=1 Tax=Pyrobaculum ferrireducens TaxID=1104324 RepID=G7VEJ4_9CREN|nr:hypothetical protein P186_0157 [Pyrobaculum ferrireducens]